MRFLITLVVPFVPRCVFPPKTKRDTHRATVKVTSGLASYVDLRCRDRNKDEQQPPEWRKERRTYVVAVGPMYRALSIRGGHNVGRIVINPVYLSRGYRKLPDLSRVGITDISQKSLFKQIGACLHPISRLVSGVPCERSRPHVAPDSITIHLSHRRRTDFYTYNTIVIKEKRTSGLSSRVPVESEKVQHNSEAAEKIQLCEKDDKVRRAIALRAYHLVSISLKFVFVSSLTPARAAHTRKRSPQPGSRESIHV
ncbi:hypothetical protein ALC57_10855 [Trachymyrmex cornetzi]|uniref:Uncharacterized protein n=1 Tax=Trachymyrmex cornetzi TaxID=471704 RepID=A0A195DVK5_9HYME|nr:hypothetical protein ALC57_10855 [Trachymyrmex cornetzi]